MNKSEKFNNLLNECLDRILKGETVEQCLKSYPEQTRELEPLLRTALAARAASIIQPRSDFKAQARREFQSALQDMANKKTQRQPLISLHWQWSSSWAIVVIALIVVVLGGGGTIAAANNSMPDSVLYPVKLATEEFQLALTYSDIDRTELNDSLANRRADEIVYLASKGDVDRVAIAANRLNSNLENMTKLTSKEVLNKAAISPKDALPADGQATVALGTATPTMSPEALTPTNASEIADEPLAADISEQAPSDKLIEKVENTTQTAQNQNELSAEYAGSKVLSPKLEKLKKIISANFEQRQHRLEEAFKKAPLNVKPTLRITIAKSRSEYDKAIQNLYDTTPEKD